jgi:hypothetical protein
MKRRDEIRITIKSPNGRDLLEIVCTSDKNRLFYDFSNDQMIVGQILVERSIPVEEQQESLFPEVILEKEKTPKAKKNDAANECFFIATYVKAYQKRYGEKCRPDLGGKAQGVIKTLLKDTPIQRACELIQVYLQIDNKWFITKAHDIVTFKENLNVIGNALDKGTDSVGGTDWTQFEWDK